MRGRNGRRDSRLAAINWGGWARCHTPIFARRRHTLRACALRALNENIENNPMQSIMVLPFERSRKNILTRRANHWHIFIVARIKPAPENPPRAF
jgi:hypothetical protein